MARLKVVGLLAFAVALTGTAYAEVQNVKVSGDIDMKAIIHANYDLKTKQKNEPGSTGGTTPLVSNDDNANFYLSTVHVGVDADLTDNVSAHVKLLNQHKWGAQTAAVDDIHIDNAYVTLKEFLYSPLTVIAGRQNLKYGTGFIVGDGLLADPNGVFGSSIGREYSAFNAYDAIRFILDYAPITVEGLISKVAETNVSSDDTDLYGVIVNYKLDRWNAEIEPYWFYKADGAAGLTVSDSGLTARSFENNYVHTVGLRLAGSPIENLQLSGEGAHQWGTLIDDSPYQERQRDAWGANVDARYTWAHVPWTPVTGVGWVFYSGERSKQPAGVGLGDLDEGDHYNAWDSMYRGSFTTYIQDFLAGNDGGGLYTTFDTNDTSATTNRHLLYADVGAKALEDLTLWARYTHAWFDKAPRIGRSRNAGDEVDVKAVYDYTEDVQLAVFGGWFFPGSYYDQPTSSARGNDLAWTAGGSAAVKF